MKVRFGSIVIISLLATLLAFVVISVTSCSPREREEEFSQIRATSFQALQITYPCPYCGGEHTTQPLDMIKFRLDDGHDWLFMRDTKTFVHSPDCEKCKQQRLHELDSIKTEIVNELSMKSANQSSSYSSIYGW